jgi:hypothetical protein
VCLKRSAYHSEIVSRHSIDSGAALLAGEILAYRLGAGLLAREFGMRAQECEALLGRRRSHDIGHGVMKAGAAIERA